jgi:predicted ArsR family transcriptional regulator
MDTTRQRILEQLRAKHTLAAQELSLILGTTTANIRHHLGVLLQEGVIEIAGYRPGGGRGRPAQLYSLTQQAHAHNLDKLADALLENLLEGLTPEEQLAALRQIATRMGSQAIGVANLTQRLNACIKVLNEMNYQARWEARSPSPRVVFSHCPYARILPQHPELCQMDASLLQRMLGVSVTQIAKLAAGRQGGKVCIFTIGEVITR